MTASDIGLIVTAITALAGVYLGWRAQKTAGERAADQRKVLAEGDGAAAKAVGLLLAPLNARIDQLTADLSSANVNIATLTVALQDRDSRIRAQQVEIDELRAGVTILTGQMSEANITPRWQPRPKPGTGPLKDK